MFTFAGLAPSDVTRGKQASLRSSYMWKFRGIVLSWQIRRDFETPFSKLSSTVGKSQSKIASSLLKLDSLLLDSIAVAMLLVAKFSTRDVTASSAHYLAVSSMCLGPGSQNEFLSVYFLLFY